jgi:Tetratricopeptide repeat
MAARADSRRRIPNPAAMLLLVVGLIPTIAWPQGRSHAAAQVFLAQGELAFEDGDYQRAADLLQVAVGEDPGDGTALHWLGLSYLALGRYPEAGARLEECLRAKHPPEAGRARAKGDLEQARSLAALGPGAEPPAVEPPEIPLGPLDFRESPPRWDLTVDLGAGDDSNPAVLPEDVTGSPPLTTGPTAAEADAVAVLGVRLAQHPLFDRAGWTVGWSLAGQRSAHRDLSQLDLTNVEGAVSLAWGGDPSGWLDGPLGSVRVPSRQSRQSRQGGIAAIAQAGASSLWLGSERYLRTLEGAAGLRFRESPAWTTRIDVEARDRRFSFDGDDPFRRSGTELAVGVSQAFLLRRTDRSLRLGWREGERGGGRAFDGSFSEAFAELAAPLAPRWSLSAQGSRREDRFAHTESSLNGGGPARSDRTSRLAASLAFQLRPNLVWIASGLWIHRDSDVEFPPGYPLFDYRRTVVTSGLRWSL